MYCRKTWTYGRSGHTSRTIYIYGDGHGHGLRSSRVKFNSGSGSWFRIWYDFILNTSPSLLFHSLTLDTRACGQRVCVLAEHGRRTGPELERGWTDVANVVPRWSPSRYIRARSGANSRLGDSGTRVRLGRGPRRACASRVTGYSLHVTWPTWPACHHCSAGAGAGAGLRSILSPIPDQRPVTIDQIHLHVPLQYTGFRAIVVMYCRLISYQNPNDYGLAQLSATAVLWVLSTTKRKEQLLFRIIRQYEFSRRGNQQTMNTEVIGASWSND